MPVQLPLIDVAPLFDPQADHRPVAGEIDDACRAVGFFRIRGHGVPAAALARVDHLARQFFAQPDDLKAAIAMSRAGAAWRGWFPLDGELTSGRPDHKEGLYFGTRVPQDGHCTAPTCSRTTRPSWAVPCSTGSSG